MKNLIVLLSVVMTQSTFAQVTAIADIKTKYEAYAVGEKCLGDIVNFLIIRRTIFAFPRFVILFFRFHPFFLTVTLTLFPGSAFASPNVNPDTTKSQLTEWQQLDPGLREKLKHFRSATFSFDTFGGLNCTGTFISNEGHILTASHCIERAIKKHFLKFNNLDGYRYAVDNSQYILKETAQNYLSQIPGSLRGSSIIAYPGELFLGFQVGQMKSEDVREFIYSSLYKDKEINSDLVLSEWPKQMKDLPLEVSINGEKTQVKVLALGLGDLSSPDRKEGTDGYDFQLRTWQSLVSLGYGAGGDFAVLKIEKKNTPCLPLSETSPADGETLEVLSSTCMDGYSSELDRRGQNVFYGSGFRDNRRAEKYFPDDFIHPLFTTTILGLPCSSGSAFVGHDGSIKGVMTKMMQLWSRLVDPPLQLEMSLGVEAPHIRRVLKQKWVIGSLECKLRR